MDTPYRSEIPRRDPRGRGQARGPAATPDTWSQPQPAARPNADGQRPFEPPTSALAPLFLRRLERIHRWRIPFAVDINTRPTTHVLGGYYKSRRLVRVYSHDRKDGRRPLDELFETFLHEVAHHLEYTEPQTFDAKACRRVPGRMHSDLFWRILGELKFRWTEVLAGHRAEAPARPR